MKSILLSFVSLIYYSYPGNFGPNGSLVIERVNLSIDGPQLLLSLRKQARVAALFALMAAASANGGSIGGRGIADVPPVAQEEAQHEEAEQNNADQQGFVARRATVARCVSPEPHEEFQATATKRDAGQIEDTSAKRQRTAA